MSRLKQIFFNEKAIPQISLFNSLLILVLISGSISWLFISDYYSQFEKDSQQLEEKYVQQQKNIIRRNVASEIIRFNRYRQQARNLLKVKVKERVYLAHIAAINLYKKYKNQKSNSELKLMIAELLRKQKNSKINNYFFVDNVYGVSQLEIKDTSEEEKFIIKKFREIAATKGEGYVEYQWPKAGTNEKGLKYSFIKYFKPFNWYIGTGEFIEDIENEFKQETIQTLSLTEDSLAQNKYFFLYEVTDIKGGINFAKMLINKNRPDLIGKYISDDYKDAKNNQFRKTMLEQIRKNGECFVKYWYRKPNDATPHPKLAYFKYFPEWNWIVAQGFYFDDLDEDIKLKKNKLQDKIESKVIYLVIFILVFMFLSIAISFLFSEFIRSILEGYRKQVEKRTSELSESNEKLATEIEERIKAENESNYLASILEWSKDLAVIKDVNLKLINCNPAFLSVAKKDNVTDLTGKSEVEIFDWDRNSKYVKRYIEDDLDVLKLNPGEMVQREDHFKLPSGKKRIMLTRKFPVFDKKGEIIGVAMIANDITELKKSEGILRQSEEKYRILAEQTGQLVYDYNVNTGMINWAGAITQLTGYDPDVFQAIDANMWREMVHPEDRHLAAVFTDPGKRKKSDSNVEYRLRVKDKDYIHVADNCAYLKDKTGNINRVIGTIQDISYRKRAVAIMQKIDNRVAVLSRIGACLAILNADGELEFCNQAFYSELGYDENHLVDLPEYSMIKIEENNNQSRLEQKVELAITVSGKNKIKRKAIRSIFKQGEIEEKRVFIFPNQI